MLRTSFSAVFLTLMLNLFPSISQAHTEHTEIQVKSTFEVNNDQQLSAISMVWLYDTFTSNDMLSHEKDINRLAKILISDLSRFNFFTRLNSADRRLVANRINKYNLTKVKDEDNNPALQLSLTLLFNKPVKIEELKTIDIVHKDPTGKAILFYDNSQDIALTDQLKTKCKSSVKDKAEFIEGQFPQIANISCRI